ncbi:MAG: 50S ribosomal protein L18e [Nanoarchaeota archaeon]|nr:50S ribosomal protein L18e [Nanoarchaeota archaeon]MBU1501434.1 50S ribosomal protein L18e [Nanoarchaeota archaeon]MBU2459089.1 50S ribosomal protein L18e [Nanoarchaeota archaeon]
MIKTKTKIEKQLQKKTGSVVETVIAAKKENGWMEVASILSGSRKNSSNLNLSEIDDKVKDGESIVIPGKVLSGGELNKKVKVVAFGFSEKAKEKLLKSKIQTSSIIEEIKKNPEAKGIRILRK